jgi:hypothetical protein
MASPRRGPCGPVWLISYVSNALGISAQGSLTRMSKIEVCLFSIVLATAMTIISSCSSSKPHVMETTVTQTNPDTGTTMTKTNGVAEKKDQSTTWSSTTIKKD